MLNHWSYATLQDRMARERELAEQRRQALAVARKPTLSARTARRLFALAAVLDRRETWSAVWERPAATGRLSTERTEGLTGGGRGNKARRERLPKGAGR